MPEKDLSHINRENQPSMVDVSGKSITTRVAKARSTVRLTPEIADLFSQGDIQSKKGPVFQTAIIAGTMAAKQTSNLIPLCHPLAIEKCHIDIKLEGLNAVIHCTVQVSGKTGVEMEALTGASIAALTIYDMCKAMSHDLIITETKLLEKTGGKGDFSTSIV